MYCSKCGKEIEEGSKFCSGCGAAQEKTDNQQQPDYWSCEEAPVPYNTMCIVGIVLSGISLFFSFSGLAGIAGFILSRMGFRQISETGERGEELAIAGMVIGGITAVYGIVVLLVSMNVLSTIGSLF
jgi:hypothetical protein